MNIFHKITKTKQDQLFFEHDILGSDGRLTIEGLKVFVDLLFVGKSIEEARKLIEEEIKKEEEEKQ